MTTIDTRRAAEFDPLAPEEHRGLPARMGIGPGLFGGAIMLAVLAILSLPRSLPITWGLRLIATTVLGPDAMEGGVGVTLVGLVLHFAVSAALGALFVRVVGRTTRRRALALGLLAGLFVWMVAQFLFLPFANPLLATEFGTVWPFFLGHLGWGVSVASAIPTVADIDAPPRRYLDPLRREVRP